METSIQVKALVKILRKRLLLILSIIVMAMALAAYLSYYVITPVYQAETQILINQKNTDQQLYTGGYSIETDLQLINTYNVIIKSPAILSKVIKELKLELSPEQLAEKITVSNENKSQVVSIKVLDEQSARAVEIANTIIDVFKGDIQKLMNVDNINVLSVATLADDSQPVKPKKILNISISGLLGLLLGTGIAFSLEFFDSTIKTEQEIEELLNLPILGFVSSIKGGRGSISTRRGRRVT
ncbi:capsular biosynthesis protein [Lysinibacillus sphaericus]|uniref:Capsular biosynthesis protein n=1 Tax=Lysinibacillus sphaericus TaxID=1421 RepID=A0A544UWK9_LYSSH|nr:Wzz/FepE/Etk N-terminal domain-containing protein [Lysinibacillus sp. SDF0037]TQR38220.1 capsular biosynthesis protein [Lysinibacillus sp. SDF0037]